MIDPEITIVLILIVMVHVMSLLEAIRFTLEDLFRVSPNWKKTCYLVNSSFSNGSLFAIADNLDYRRNSAFGSSHVPVRSRVCPVTQFWELLRFLTRGGRGTRMVWRKNRSKYRRSAQFWCTQCCYANVGQRTQSIGDSRATSSERANCNHSISMIVTAHLHQGRIQRVGSQIGVPSACSYTSPWGKRQWAWAYWVYCGWADPSENSHSVNLLQHEMSTTIFLHFALSRVARECAKWSDNGSYFPFNS